MPHHWILYDTTGEEIRTTEDFPSQPAAEEWMREQWAALVEEGAASARLATPEGRVYDMGLAEQ